MTRILIAVFVYLAGFAQAGAEEFSVGSWHGDAYFDDRSGEFTHCAISAEYRSDDTLVFSITRTGKIVLGLSNPQWRLQEGERYPVYLRVDRRDLGRYEAEANLDTAVYVYLPYSEELIRLLRKGRVLYFEASRETLRYKLTGTSAALPRLQDCVYRELFSGQIARNPFASGRGRSGSQNPFGGGSDTRSQSERDTADSVALMLREAGLSDYQFVPESARPENLSDATYVWTNGTVIGAVFAYELGEFGLGLASSVVLSGYEESCGGQFTFGTRTEEAGDGTQMRRVAAKCAERDGDLLMSFVFFELDEFVATVLHIADGSAGAAVREADESIYRYFRGY